jgi:hypothetical protein
MKDSRQSPSAYRPGATDLCDYTFEVAGATTIPRRNVYFGTRPPTSADDDTKDFRRGSRWIFGARIFECTDSTEANAQWTEAGANALAKRLIVTPLWYDLTGVFFSNSAYVPGVQINTPALGPGGMASFGFYPIQSFNFLFNPFLVLGANRTYTITMAVRLQAGAIVGTGLRACLRQVVANVGESGINGLLDFAASTEYSSAESAVQNSGTTSQFMYFRSYFAAAGAQAAPVVSSARINDVTIFIREV